MVYVVCAMPGGSSLGLARGSYCDHNVVGTIWEIDGCWAKQLESGQSTVADQADRSGVDRDLGLFGIRLGRAFQTVNGLNLQHFLAIDDDNVSFFWHIFNELLNLLIRSETPLHQGTIHAASLPNLSTFKLSQSSPASLSGMPTRLHLRAILP